FRRRRRTGAAWREPRRFSRSGGNQPGDGRTHAALPAVADRDSADGGIHREVRRDLERGAWRPYRTGRTGGAVQRGFGVLLLARGGRHVHGRTRGIGAGTPSSRCVGRAGRRGLGHDYRRDFSEHVRAVDDTTIMTVFE